MRRAALRVATEERAHYAVPMQRAALLPPKDPPWYAPCGSRDGYCSNRLAVARGLPRALPSEGVALHAGSASLPLSVPRRYVLFSGVAEVEPDQRVLKVANHRLLAECGLLEHQRRPAPHADGRRLLRKQPVQVRQQVLDGPQARHARFVRLVRRGAQPVGVGVGRVVIAVLLVVDDNILDAIGQRLGRPQLAKAELSVGALVALAVLYALR